MKNGYRIDWSEEAIKNLDSIIYYLSDKWTIREISNFYKLLDKKLVLISKNPDIFSNSGLNQMSKDVSFPNKHQFTSK